VHGLDKIKGHLPLDLLEVDVGHSLRVLLDNNVALVGVNDEVTGFMPPFESFEILQIFEITSSGAMLAMPLLFSHIPWMFLRPSTSTSIIFVNPQLLCPMSPRLASCTCSRRSQ
jgi:hypothetical protein